MNHLLNLITYTVIIAIIYGVLSLGVMYFGNETPTLKFFPIVWVGCLILIGLNQGEKSG